MKCIVVFGDLSDGLEFVGPFDNEDAARDYGHEYCTAAAWSVQVLDAPYEVQP